MNNLQFLPSLTKFCMTVGEIPSGYLLRMSYEEQLIWVCHYLETKVIPAMNNNAEATKELQALYLELKKYVDDYFSNLDVQTEINNKLDDMAESGDLPEIISQYLELQSVLAYDSVDDMKDATNLIAGSFAKTYGFNSCGDGEGGYYKIRALTNDDVIDNKTIISLNDPTLVAELILDINVKKYNTVANMIAGANLVAGDVVQTAGYYSANDGGGALYKIRKINVSDTTNSSTLILLADTNYVAELIVNDSLNVKQFGAKGDGTTDDTTAINNAIGFLRVYPRNDKDYTELYFPNGEYKVTDTLLIQNARYNKIYGKATIFADINKPILKLSGSMWCEIDDLLILQTNTGSSASGIEIENSYTCSFNNLYINGGYIGINIVYGNALSFNTVTTHQCYYGLYTEATSNNTDNVFNGCTFEGSSVYDVYLGYSQPYYGLYTFNNCYIESSSDYALIYIENAMNCNFIRCYINQTKNNGTIIHQSGTFPNMRAKFIGNQFFATGGNAYLIKQLTDFTKGVRFDNTNFFSSGITMFNNEDSIIPKIGKINRDKLNIYNLTNFVTGANDKLIDWLGSGTYTLGDSIDPESINSVEISSGYIYKKIYLKANVTYDFETMIKTDGSSNASIELFNEDLDTVYFTASSTATSWTKLTKTYTPTISQTYTLLLKQHSTNVSFFCGLNIYSNELNLEY